MELITAIIIIGITVAGGAFIGTSVSNAVFKDNKSIESEIKSEIHVLSSDIHGIGILEIILIVLVVFIIAAVIGVAVTYFVLKKKSKKPKVEEISLEDISISGK